MSLHAYDPELTYEDILARLRQSSGDGIEARFAIGRFTDIALSMGVVFEQIIHDSGLSKSTLERYLSAWRLWGENRIPGEPIVWTDYVRHLDAKVPANWVEAHDWRARALDEGRSAVDALCAEWREEHAARRAEARDAKAAVVDMRAWRVTNARSILWNAISALDGVDFGTCTAEERKVLATHFSMVLNQAEKFRKACQ